MIRVFILVIVTLGMAHFDSATNAAFAQQQGSIVSTNSISSNLIVGQENEVNSSRGEVAEPNETEPLEPATDSDHGSDWSLTPLNVIIIVANIVGLILMIAVGVLLFRKPQLLAFTRRANGVQISLAFCILIWYFILGPGVGFEIAKRCNLLPTEGTSLTLRLLALRSWLGYFVMVPIPVVLCFGLQQARLRSDWKDLTEPTNAAALATAADNRPRSWLASIGVGLAGAGIIFPIVLMTNTVSRAIHMWYTDAVPEQIAHDTLALLHRANADGNSIWVTLVILSVTVGAAFFEEVLYRGTLQTLIARLTRSQWLAILFASLIFASRHIPVANAEVLPGLFVLSAGMGFAYVRTGRLITPIIIHVLFNAMNIAMMYLFTSPVGG